MQGQGSNESEGHMQSGKSRKQVARRATEKAIMWMLGSQFQMSCCAVVVAWQAQSGLPNCAWNLESATAHGSHGSGQLGEAGRLPLRRFLLPWRAATSAAASSWVMGRSWSSY